MRKVQHLLTFYTLHGVKSMICTRSYKSTKRYAFSRMWRFKALYFTIKPI